MDDRNEFEQLIQHLPIEAINELISLANKFLQSSKADFCPHD